MRKQKTEHKTVQSNSPLDMSLQNIWEQKRFTNLQLYESAKNDGTESKKKIEIKNLLQICDLMKLKLKF